MVVPRDKNKGPDGAEDGADVSSKENSGGRVVSLPPYNHAVAAQAREAVSPEIEAVLKNIDAFNVDEHVKQALHRVFEMEQEDGRIFEDADAVAMLVEMDKFKQLFASYEVHKNYMPLDAWRTYSIFRGILKGEQEKYKGTILERELHSWGPRGVHLMKMLLWALEDLDSGFTYLGDAPNIKPKENL